MVESPGFLFWLWMQQMRVYMLAPRFVRSKPRPESLSPDKHLGFVSYVPLTILYVAPGTNKSNAWTASSFWGVSQRQPEV